ncbi:MAG: helix-turn-helix domain-containing protein [Micromonosporaceae bacterium]
MAATAPLAQETYLPSDEGVAEVYDFIAAHEARGRGSVTPRYFLAGATAGDRVELPEEMYRLLRQVAEALQRGLAVTVAPVAKQITTQQAADLLGVSRPTVIKLLDEGKIAFERAGTHRRIRLKDLLEYRERRRSAQYAALEATSAAIEEEDDLETTLQRLRETKRVVSERRRSRMS